MWTRVVRRRDPSLAGLPSSIRLLSSEVIPPKSSVLNSLRSRFVLFLLLFFLLLPPPSSSSSPSTPSPPSSPLSPTLPLRFRSSSPTPLSPSSRVRPGRLSAERVVPADIERPPYVVRGYPPMNHPPMLVHDAVGIQRMRDACALARDALAFAGSLVRPGVTTDEIDAQTHEFLVRHGAYPSPLRYGTFPKSICTSVNEVAVHGIPDDRPLLDGDVISIDVSCFLRGFHGDTCRTFFVGAPDPETRRLVATAKEALDAGVAAAGPGVAVGSLGTAIWSVVQREKYDTVREFMGHGVGRDFHTLPLVAHYPSRDPTKLPVGITFTIEPILVAGSARLVMWKDGWTAAAADGSRSAQFEHTLLVTEHGVEVLTGYPEEAEERSVEFREGRARVAAEGARS